MTISRSARAASATASAAACATAAVSWKTRTRTLKPPSFGPSFLEEVEGEGHRAAGGLDGEPGGTGGGKVELAGEGLHDRRAALEDPARQHHGIRLIPQLQLPGD